MENPTIPNGPGGGPNKMGTANQNLAAAEDMSSFKTKEGAIIYVSADGSAMDEAGVAMADGTYPLETGEVLTITDGIAEITEAAATAGEEHKEGGEEMKAAMSRIAILEKKLANIASGKFSKSKSEPKTEAPPTFNPFKFTTFKK